MTIKNALILLISSINKNDYIYLIQEKLHNFTWGLPGGGVNKGEHPWMAAVREFKEETGHIWNNIPRGYSFKNIMVDKKTIAYTFKVKDWMPSDAAFRSRPEIGGKNETANHKLFLILDVLNDEILLRFGDELKKLLNELGYHKVPIIKY